MGTWHQRNSQWRRCNRGLITPGSTCSSRILRSLNLKLNRLRLYTMSTSIGGFVSVKSTDYHTRDVLASSTKIVDFGYYHSLEK